jgi:hypothetical protein
MVLSVPAVRGELVALVQQQPLVPVGCAALRADQNEVTTQLLAAQV